MRSFAGEYGRLNEAQKTSVDSIEGPVCVIAGPGTGKTQVIACRVAAMIWSEQQISPETILCLTYTEAGVKAMRTRLVEFIGHVAYRVHIHTFHSFCDKIIRSNPYQFNMAGFRAASDSDQESVLRTVIKELSFDNPLRRTSGSVYYETRRLSWLFSLMRKEGWSPKMITDIVDNHINSLPENPDFIYKRNTKYGKAGEPNLKKIEEEKTRMTMLRAAANLLPVYISKMSDNRLYDFEDMISKVVDKFSESDDFLMRYQERYQYVLVDEFQDTGGNQLVLLRLLMNFYDIPNIFTVGDDDQSVYEFNGARIRNMIDFINIYNSTVIVLDKNYRSGQPILDAASKVITNNADRLPNIYPITKEFKAAQGRSQRFPEIYSFPDQIVEAAWVAKRIAMMVAEGTNPSSIAVLYRKHKLAEPIIAAVKSENIAVNVQRSVDALTEPIIINLLHILRYLRLIDQIESFHGDLVRMAFMPWWGVPREDVNIWVKSNYKTIPPKVEVFLALVDELRSYCLSEPANYAINKVVWAMVPGVLRRKDQHSLINALHSFRMWVDRETQSKVDIRIDDVLEIISMMEDNGMRIPCTDMDYNPTGINFMTTHGAKGLEYDTIFLIGASRKDWEGGSVSNARYTLPFGLTQTNESNEEESNRRLFYVAMTRAKSNLFISFPESDNGTGKALEPSKFVYESELSLIPVKTFDPGYIDRVKLALTTPFDFDPTASKRQVEEWLQGYQMSITHLNTYLECPVKFFYRYVMRVPSSPVPAMLYGTAIHQTLKWAYDAAKGDAHISEDSLVQTFINMMDNVRGMMNHEEYKRRVHLGAASLRTWYEELWFESRKTVLTEFSAHNIMIGAVPFRGDIDKIEFSGNDVAVVDYKTGNPYSAKAKLKPPSEDNPNGGEYWRQLVGYVAIINAISWQVWKPKEAALELIGEKPERVFITFDNNDVNQFIQILQDTYEKIIDQQFSHGCGECEWCQAIGK